MGNSLKKNISMTSETNNKIEQLAKKYSITKAAVVAIAVQKYYEEEERRSERK